MMLFLQLILLLLPPYSLNTDPVCEGGKGAPEDVAGEGAGAVPEAGSVAEVGAEALEALEERLESAMKARSLEVVKLGARLEGLARTVHQLNQNSQVGLSVELLVSKFIWYLYHHAKFAKGNPALAKVGLGEEDSISPRAQFFPA